MSSPTEERWSTGATRDDYCAGVLTERSGLMFQCMNFPTQVRRTVTGYLHPLCDRCAAQPGNRDMEFVRAVAL